MNAQESRIGVGEIVRKMQAMVAWHPTRFEPHLHMQKKKKLTSSSINLKKKTALGEADA